MKISQLKTFVGLLLASVGSAVLIDFPAAANPYVNQIKAQLIMGARSVGLGGYQATHTPKIGQLRDNTQTNIGLNLRSGATYKLVGVCDSDCGDLDLQLLDSNGNVIDTDVEYDDYPVVSVTPRWSDRFVIRVGMPSCNATYCNYGVGVFGR